MLFALLLALLVVARLYDLAADPPAWFAKASQSLSTDAGHLTWHARNMALFGSWDLFGYDFWWTFKTTAITATTFLSFALFGVSRVAANLAGVVLNLLGIGAFLMGLRKLVSRRTLLFTLFFLATCFILTVYSRLPFAENSLVFFAGVTFLVYAYWFGKAWGKVAVGLLVGLGALLGKPVGLPLLAGPLLALWLSSEHRKLASSIVMILAAILPLVAAEVLITGDGGVLALVAHHATRSGGLPGGLQSVTGFFEHLIAFSARAKLIASLPAAALIVWWLIVQVVRGEWRGMLSDNAGRPVAFLLGWTAATIVFMAPFNYLPMRYFLPLILPVCALAATGLEAVLNRSGAELPRLSIIRLIALLSVNWVLVYYMLVRLYQQPTFIGDFYRWVWYALPGAIVLTAVFWAARRFRFDSLPRQVGVVVVAAAVLFTAGLFAYDTADWLSRRTYGLAEANEDIGRILGADAVLTGPYGPALVADNGRACIPYYKDDADSRTDDARRLAELCSHYPITHIATSKQHWLDLADHHPAFRHAPILARYWIRNRTVVVVRVNDLFGNRPAADYQPTGFERAHALYGAGAFDSAGSTMARFVADNPRSKAALLDQYYFVLGKQGPEAGEPYVVRLLELYPNDYSVQAVAALYYFDLARKDNDHYLERKAEQHLQAALRQNSRGEEQLRALRERFGAYGHVL